MYGSRNLGNGKVEIQKAIKLAQCLATELGVRLILRVNSLSSKLRIGNIVLR